MHYRMALLLIVVVAAWRGAAAQLPDPAAADEKILEAAKLKSDAASLLEFFRRRTLPDAEREKYRAYVKQLGSEIFRQREQAMTELVARGPVVVDLLGSNEVPPVTTAARGHGEFRITGGFGLQYLVTVEDIQAITTSHLHRGAPGENGPPVLWLYDATGANAPGGAFDPANPLRGSATPTAEILADLLAGRLYINVHTLQHPGGEIRGQLVPGASAAGSVIFLPIAQQS